MNKVKSAIINSSVTSFLMQAMALLTSVIVARLLTPGEIGTYAVVSASVMILSEFKALGAGVYLVREAEISVAKIRSALGVTILMSWGLAAIIMLAAQPIAIFYGLPDAPLIMLILCSTFIISPYVSIPYALLVREMDFGILRNVKLTCALITLVSTVVFIILGLSYYSLALGYSLGFFARFILLNTLYRVKLMEYKPSFSHLAEITKLGVSTTAAEFLKKAYNVMPDMVIGRQGTTYDVGIFSRGYGFVQFISDGLRMGVGMVSLPYVASVKRSGGDLSEAYIKGSYLFNALALPVLAVASVSSLPVIRFLFGEQWDAAAPIASILMLWSALRIIHFQFQSFMIAMGLPNIVVIREALNVIAAMIVCFILYPAGLVAIAWGFVVIALIEFLLLIVVMKKLVSLSIRQFGTATLKNLLMTVLCLLPVLLFNYYYDFTLGNAFVIVLSIAAFMPFWWLMWLWLTKHGLFKEIFSSRASS